MKSARVALGLALLAACGEEPRSDLEAPALEIYETELVGEPLPDLGVEVEILEPGREPRRRLRYRLEPGTAQTVTTSERTTMSMVIGGSRLMEREFPSSSVYTVRVTGLESEGRARISLKIDDMELSDMSGQFGPRAPAGEESALALQKQSITALFDDRGLKQEEDRGELTEGDLSPFAGQALERIVEMIAIPLPEEPIGVGGRWRVSQTVHSYGLYLPLENEYLIKEVEGSRVALSTRYRGGAPAQKLGPMTDLRSLEGKTDGTLTLDITRPVPIESESSASFTMEMRARSDGEIADFSMVIEEEQRMTSK